MPTPAAAPGGHAGDSRAGVQQRHQLPAPGYRCGQRICCAFWIAIRPVRQWNARPIDPQRTGVGDAVGGIMQRGDHVVEQVLNVQPQAIQIALS